MGLCCNRKEEADDPGVMMTRGKEKVKLNDFIFEKVIGRGSFGKVMLVTKKDTQEVFAMKILKKEMLELRNQRAHTRTERDVLVKIKSPFIVQLQYAFQTPEKLYFVMEYLAGGELFFHLRKERRFTEERARFYAAEIILALECMHKNDIIYRDLKPENVLINSDGHIKITDFGLSKSGVAMGSKKAYTFCGTPEYLAPEIIKGVGHDKAVDWWSLGALIFEMLCGRPPFCNKNKQLLLKSIIEKPVEMRPSFSEPAKSLLTALLCINPQKRLGSSMKDAEEIKEHPFFLNHIDWDALEKRELEVPFLPSVAGKDDSKNFDKMFTREPVVDTPETSKLSNNEAKEMLYEGFTYARTDLLEQGKKAP